MCAGILGKEEQHDEVWEDAIFNLFFFLCLQCLCCHGNQDEIMVSVCVLV